MDLFREKTAAPSPFLKGEGIKKTSKPLVFKWNGKDSGLSQPFRMQIHLSKERVNPGLHSFYDLKMCPNSELHPF